MPRLAANLSFLFKEHPFLDRFGAAGARGFKGVEFMFPYDWSIDEIGRAAADAGVRVVLFNLPPGDWEAGDRGLAAIPGREVEFRDSVEPALEAARKLGVTALHVMAGVPDVELNEREVTETYVENLRYVSSRAPEGVMFTIEPINRRDMPGYFLSTTRKAETVFEMLRCDRVKLQLDLYHAQNSEGDLSRLISKHFHNLGHVQIAGNPGRNEPSRGEIHYPFLLDQLDSMGYAGWVGCEYQPFGGTLEGLSWAVPYGIAP